MSSFSWSQPLASLGLIVALLLFTRLRGARLINAGRITQAGLDRFLIWSFAVLGGGIVAQTAIQLLGGQPDLPCRSAFPPHSAAGIAALTLHVVLLVVILRWIWFRGGDRTLAIILPVTTHGIGDGETPFSPRTVRWVVSVLLFIGPVVSLLAGYLEPTLKSCGST
jgi:hypothetical protein